jgi:hypothetical protein
MHRDVRERKFPLESCWRLGAALALLVLAPGAQADCTSREATPAERQYSERLSAALVAAMPAAPANMWLPAAPRVAMGTLCKDTPVGDLEANVYARYHYRMSPAEAERLTRERRDLEAQMSAMKVLPPDLKREYDAIDAQAQQAFREAREAEKASNKGLATQKYNESSALGAQRDAVRKRHLDAIKPQFDAVESKWRAQPSEVGEFDVVLKTNGYPTKPGASELDLVLGTLPPPRGGRSYKVFGIQAVVSGPTSNSEQRRALIAGFDRARLQALVDGPPPEMPAPAAWSVGGPPQAVSADAAVSVAPASAAPTSAASNPTAQPAATTAPPAPAPSPPPDAAQQAKDVVNKLRGLLGR